MKDNIYATLVGAAITFVFFPWAVGVVDIIAWMFGEAQVSSIHWSGNQGVVAFFWPIFCLLIVACLGGMVA